MMKNLSRRPGLQAALIILLTIAAYLPALHAGFVWDDGALITDNPLVKASDGLRRFWFTTEAPDYYPLTWSLWWLEWRCWGASAAGYHVVNILLHAVNAVLVWGILSRLKIPGAWLAGLVFAVHPVNVATVAWISEQKNTLSMLFYTVATLLYLRFDEERRWRWYALSLGAFLLALLSKSAVVVLPVVLLGCIWWRRGQVRRNDFLCSLPYFAFSLAFGLLTIWFQYHRVLEVQAVRTAGWLPRLAAAGWVPWFYMYKALLPFGLTAIYPLWHVDASRWVVYVPGISLAGCVTLFWWKRNSWGRGLFFGFVYFLATLFPVLGFIDQGFYRQSLVADHWQYYSIVGVIAMAVAGWDLIWRRIGERGRDWRAVTGVAVLLGLAAATWGRCQVYTGSESLWRDNVAKNPNAWVAYYDLGNALLRAGRIQDAIGQYGQAVRLKPDYEAAHNNLAYALLQVGDVNGAIGHLEQALRVTPNSAEGHCNLGRALLQAGRTEDAIGHYAQAVRLKPDYTEAHHGYGMALASKGRSEEAISEYLKALQYRPDYAEARNDLGAALVSQGKLDEAVSSFATALRLAPDYAEAHYNLGVVLARQGKIEEAIRHLQSAVRLEPGSERFHRVLNRLQQVSARPETP